MFVCRRMRLPSLVCCFSSAGCHHLSSVGALSLFMRYLFQSSALSCAAVCSQSSSFPCALLCLLLDLSFSGSIFASFPCQACLAFFSSWRFYFSGFPFTPPPHPIFTLHSLSSFFMEISFICQFFFSSTALPTTPPPFSLIHFEITFSAGLQYSPCLPFPQ